MIWKFLQTAGTQNFRISEHFIFYFWNEKYIILRRTHLWNRNGEEHSGRMSQLSGEEPRGRILDAASSHKQGL